MVTKSVFDICNIVVIGEFEWEKTKVKKIAWIYMF